MYQILYIYLPDKAHSALEGHFSESPSVPFYITSLALQVLASRTVVAKSFPLQVWFSNFS